MGLELRNIRLISYQNVFETEDCIDWGCDYLYVAKFTLEKAKTNSHGIGMYSKIGINIIS